MASPVAFGLDIAVAVNIAWRCHRHAFDHAQAAGLDLRALVGVVGNQLPPRYAKFLKHPAGRHEMALIHLEAKRVVGIDGIKPVILQGIGAHLVEKADIAALLCKIDKNAAASLGHHRQRALKLVAAVAFEAAKDITGDALRMQPHQRCVGRVNLADDDRKMLFTAKLGPKHHHLGLRRHPQRHLCPCGDSQALRRGLYIAVDIAVIDGDEVIVLMQALLERRVTCRQAGDKGGRRQFGNPKKSGGVIGKRAAPLADKRRYPVKHPVSGLVDGKLPDPVMVKIMRRQAGTAEFRLKLAAKAVHARLGENQHRARSGKPLHLVTRLVAGKFGGLQQAGSTVRQPQQHKATAPQVAAGTVSFQIGSVCVRVPHHDAFWSVTGLRGFSNLLFRVSLPQYDYAMPPCME